MGAKLDVVAASHLRGAAYASEVEQERAWRVAIRVAGWVVVGLLVVLVATGIALTFRYRPDVSSAYANVTSLEHRSVFSARSVHRFAAVLLLPAVGCLTIACIGLFVVRHDHRWIALPLVAGALTVGAGISGYLLPWDQLALWRVSVGTNMQGYMPILRGHDVKFVLIGAQEMSTATFSRWFWVHSVAVPVALVGVLLALGFAVRRGSGVRGGR